MKYKFLKLFLILICLGLLSLIRAKAQQNLEPPEIKGSSSQVYQELKIEITGLKRVQEYQPYFVNSNTPRGRKLIAEEGQEIAVVKIRTTRLGKNPAIRLYYLYLLDAENKSYKGFFQTFAIGTAGERKLNNPEQLDYEFPVQVPKGTKISAVQLHQPVHQDTQPYVVIQRITFDVSALDL